MPPPRKTIREETEADDIKPTDVPSTNSLEARAELRDAQRDLPEGTTTPNPILAREKRIVHDILQTAVLLRTRLPADLIPIILDFAELWAPFVATGPIRGTRVHEGNSGQVQASLVVPSYVAPGSIRRIRITTRSKDQGWSSDKSEVHGTYKHSWTWFEAGVKGLQQNGEGEDTANDEAAPKERENGARVNSPKYKYGAMIIVTNIHAGKEIKQHDVVWDAWHEELDVRKILREIRSGCAIEVTAHARFPGWVNCVEQVQIEVDCAVVRK